MHTTERISSFERKNWSTEFAGTPLDSSTFSTLKPPLPENPNEAKFAWNEKIQGNNNHTQIKLKIFSTLSD